MGRRKKRKFNFNEVVPEVDSSVKKGIFIVLIFLLAILSLLSIFDLAGVFGRYFYQFLKLLLGWDFWFFPIILFVLGYLSLDNTRYKFSGLNWTGAFLFVVGLTAFTHLIHEPSSYRAMLGQTSGGGYIGYALAVPLYKLMGRWAGLVVSLALIVSGLILVFNLALEELLARLTFKKIRLWINSWWLSRKYGDDEIDEAEEKSNEFEEESDGQQEEGGLKFKGKEVGNRELGFEAKGKKINGTESVEAADEQKVVAAKKIRKKYSKIDLPLSLLNDKSGKPTSGDIKAHQEVIKKTLKNFGIEVEMGEVAVGPTVTQYTFRPAEGVKLSRIIGLGNDLALALAAHPIRIEAPIPGKSLVGIEVPNKKVALVPLKKVLASKDFRERKNNMHIALGQDVAGRAWMVDLSKLPHLLVAGATNSGKTVCLNSIIISLLYQNQPDELKLILVDPKRVEMPIYNGIPHLMTPVITDVKKTVNALKWTISEMDRRFSVLSKTGKRNIQSYNNTHQQDRLPYLVFVIDELADLMSVMGAEVEAAVIRLAQMSRAVGIHLVLATQRPSVDIITGLIKANVPGRIAFAVSSLMDSRTILDTAGAEKLLGRGDMLFTSPQVSKPKRLQGAYCSDNDIERVVEYLREHAEPDYEEGVVEVQPTLGLGGVVTVGSEGGGGDELLPQARELVVEAGKASASYLQRRLGIGYPRAASLLDSLEEQGVVGPAQGSKARKVLIKAGEKSLVEQADDILNSSPRSAVEDLPSTLADANERENEVVELDEKVVKTGSKEIEKENNIEDEDNEDGVNKSEVSENKEDKYNF